MTFSQELIALIFTPSAVIVVIAYLLRLWLSSQITRDLETFKSQLERSLFEYKTKFSLLHETRAQVIGELYGKITKTSSMLSRLINFFQPSDDVSLLEKKKAVAEVANEMGEYYNEKRIYLDDSTCKMIDEILDTLHAVFLSFNIGQMGDTYEPDDSGLWIKANEDFKEKWPPLKKALETEFRDILQGKRLIGVEDA